MELVLGLDGGGSKTEAVVINRRGGVVVWLRSDGLDPHDLGWQVRLAALAAELGPVSAAVLGLPCYGEIADVSAGQDAVVAELFGAQAVVLNDVAVAFNGALAGAEGVLVLAGTGSMAWARGPGGTHRVGGWGHLFGDEGSAHWIGRTALALVSQHLDGRKPPSGFAHGLLREMGIAAEDLLGWTFAQNPRAGLASVAAWVSRLAQSGSPEAAAMLAEAATHLAQAGLTAGRLAGLAAPPRWSFAGGVMQDACVIAGLTAAMGCPPTAPLLPPVGGAALAAAQAAGWATGPEFIAGLQTELDNGADQHKRL
ncbi:MAG: BadF/BadG/BcrA/BcrD ATPase family protein [Cypionkella sp.]|uniref:N-acetylglucosamine kinase n=1 Tax=Cypionkella sp. TaxID=2811411 RepID=UPI002ABC7AAE|nr:BadF/BadG/BcrA/BcrD ATPase family protein [Cypionkella sp.]MDZ4309590.1 BadF/BadG/BcrA/BcrD ATPase family protein [Cypionkella sp.]MDZ4395570.1 BadF/BadG/BcrA/BcrD ATPase family protein [Cypionkella sp.]